MSSREFAEWQAWHRATGALTDEWQAELLASLHELLQFQAYLTGQAHFTDKHHKKGPAPKPEHYKRRYELLGPLSPLEEEDEDDDWVTPPFGETTEDGE
ncbi:hypothetical protein C6N75_10010 [Streptomyces solincola]|uniref:Uncharacterized protein n=1 Tax=Streptomyces solincola TaxID=2100817 RepID=A0A2S9PYB4_9ACTN|nr:hypothetical protein [Streptomyces solincola]PRH79408.1 hypothetical protein C6N75_10010 [Streptomyces solincola]